MVPVALPVAVAEALGKRKPLVDNAVSQESWWGRGGECYFNEGVPPYPS